MMYLAVLMYLWGLNACNYLDRWFVIYVVWVFRLQSRLVFGTHGFALTSVCQYCFVSLEGKCKLLKNYRVFEPMRSAY